MDSLGLPLGYQKRQHRSVILNSALRDAATYPNANSYVVTLPWNLERVHVAYLCTFTCITPAAMPLTANLRIRELSSSGKVDTMWPGGDGSTLACIPLTGAVGARFAYQPSSPKEIDILCLEDSRYYPSFTTLTVTWVDENGALITGFPEHVTRLMFESVYA